MSNVVEELSILSYDTLSHMTHPFDRNMTPLLTDPCAEALSNIVEELSNAVDDPSDDPVRDWRGRLTLPYPAQPSPTPLNTNLILITNVV